MKFGLALISFVANSERAKIVTRSLESLARTDINGLDCIPALDISYGESMWFDYKDVGRLFEGRFYLRVLPDPPEVPKPDIMHYSATAAAMRLLKDVQDVTHVVCMVDDYIYNPDWLRQLAALIERHPTDTRAWSVFRSRYTAFHQIVGGDGTDVLMSMHDSMGCMTRQEMTEFCRYGYVGTPDCTHAGSRPGNRWATSRDYMENLGRHHNLGIGDVDCAIDFVGEE
jgi:hypothetical protein